jgi:hypothetical protein
VQFAELAELFEGIVALLLVGKGADAAVGLPQIGSYPRGYGLLADEGELAEGALLRGVKLYSYGANGSH